MEDHIFNKPDPNKIWRSDLRTLGYLYLDPYLHILAATSIGTEVEIITNV